MSARLRRGVECGARRHHGLARERGWQRGDQARRAGCAGFVYGLVAGASMLTPDGLDHVLVVGAETLADREPGGSRHLHPVRGRGRMPTSVQTIAEGEHHLHMAGPEVFRRAVRAVVDSALATLARAGEDPKNVDWFVPHQANVRIIDAARQRLSVDAERTVVNIDRYGNTSAASIPLALGEAADDGRLRDGNLVLLSGFSAGMTWASALLRLGRP